MEVQVLSWAPLQLRKLFFIITLIFSLLSTSVFSAEPLRPELKKLGLENVNVTAEKNIDYLRELKRRQTYQAWHQGLGLATIGAVVGTVLTGGKGAASGTHKGFAIASGATYISTAIMGFLIPAEKGAVPAKNVLWHKRLAFIHGPLLLLSIPMGYKADKDFKRGNNPSGLSKYHPEISKVGYLTFLASALVLTVDF